MKNKLLSQLRAVLPVEIEIPEPIIALYKWIERNGLYIDQEDGQRTGFLFSRQQLLDSWTDDSREGGTMIEFVAYSSECLQDSLGVMNQCTAGHTYLLVQAAMAQLLLFG